MNAGKKKCEILQEIRENIAEMNGIKYCPEKCTHEGDCSGYCPKCEQEAEDLMYELSKKEAHGSPIQIDRNCLEELLNMSRQYLQNEDWDNPEPLMGDIMPPDDDNDEASAFESYMSDPQNF